MGSLLLDGNHIHLTSFPDPNQPNPPLLLIHGSGGNHRHWGKQIQGLSPIWPCMAVDLPGHGRSEGNPYTTVSEYRDFILSLLDTLSLRCVYLGGHSLGGAITLDFALHYPDRVAGLVLVGTGARLRVTRSILEPLRKGQMVPDLVKWAYAPAVNLDLLQLAQREWAKVPPSTFLADFTACDQWDVMDRLGEIRHPALIICGSEDRLTPIKYSQYLFQHIPDAQLKIVPDAGHMVMIEQPDLVNRIMIDYFQGQRG